MASAPEEPRRRSSRACNQQPIDYDDSRHLLSSPARPQGGAIGVNEPLTEREEHGNDQADDSWETDSILEDIIENSGKEQFSPDDPETCTAEEAANFRQMLRSHGPEEFCRRTVDVGAITAKKLLTAFGVRPPGFMEGAEDDAYFSLLTAAMKRELQTRIKLQKYNTVDDAVALLQSSRNIIVITGAGISTSLGIPDFRSRGTGLYSKLKVEHPGLDDPQEVFDIHVFKHDPTIFYTIAKEILPSTNRFTPTHKFIRLLQDRGKLLTNYSQNIDNIEAMAGIHPDKLVQCHGSFATASCQRCGDQVPGKTIFPEIRAGRVARCRKCALGGRTTKNSSRARKTSNPEPPSTRRSRKRKVAKDGTEIKVRRRPGQYDSNSDSEFGDAAAPTPKPTPPAAAAGDDDINHAERSPSPSSTINVGVMKPDITFFGENLPDEFEDRLMGHDRAVVDLCVVIGTSLEVAPVSQTIVVLPPSVPQIYISRTPAKANFDIELLGDCDVVVAELCRRLGWALDHEMVPAGQRVETAPVEGREYQHVFTQVEPLVAGDDKVETKDEIKVEVEEDPVEEGPVEEGPVEEGPVA